MAQDNDGGEVNETNGGPDPDSVLRDAKDIEDRSTPPTPVIYEVVRRLGEEEMARPGFSLWWSGAAAGLSISFSLLAQAVLQTHLPDVSWRPLIGSLGYTVGFVMAVLSRQQLFTESTITAVLPLMADFTPRSLWKMARIWAIVLIANFAGTLFAAAFCAFTPALTPELRAGMLEISRHLLDQDFASAFFKAVSAGFLMAAMVWMLPGAGSQLPVVVLMTYLIAAGGFLHIVAGSAEAFMLVLTGATTWRSMAALFVAPALLGNIVGGTALFGLLAYAQVVKEIQPKPQDAASRAKHER